MGIPVAIMAGVAVAGAGAEAYEQQQGAKAETSQLNMIAASQQLQYQQKTLANYGQLQTMLAAQQAQATAAGVNLGSGSLNAIQQNTLNVGARTQSNLNIESQITQNDIQSEKDAVQNTLMGRLFGDLSGVGKSGTQLALSVPTSNNNPATTPPPGPTYNPTPEYKGFSMDFSS